MKSSDELKFHISNLERRLKLQQIYENRNFSAEVTARVDQVLRLTLEARLVVSKDDKLLVSTLLTLLKDISMRDVVSKEAMFAEIILSEIRSSRIVVDTWKRQTSEGE